MVHAFPHVLIQRLFTSKNVCHSALIIPTWVHRTNRTYVLTATSHAPAATMAQIWIAQHAVPSSSYHSSMMGSALAHVLIINTRILRTIHVWLEDAQKVCSPLDLASVLLNAQMVPKQITTPAWAATTPVSPVKEAPLTAQVAHTQANCRATILALCRAP